MVLTNSMFNNDSHVMKEGLMENQEAFEILNTAIDGQTVTLGRFGQLLDKLHDNGKEYSDRLSALEKKCATQEFQIKKLFASVGERAEATAVLHETMEELFKDQGVIDDAVENLFIQIIRTIEPGVVTTQSIKERVATEYLNEKMKATFEKEEVTDE